MSIEEVPFSIGPGRYIAEALEDSGRTVEDLGNQPGFSLELVRGLLAGTAQIDDAVAETLSGFFGTSKSLWLNLENSFRSSLDSSSPALTVEAVKERQEVQKVKREAGGVVTLRVPRTMHSRIRHLAESEGVSMNQMLLSIISEGVSRYETLKDGGMADAA